MKKGDIVLITFPFSDLSGSKLRPAIILCTNKLDITVCFITTRLGWQEPTDILIILLKTLGCFYQVNPLLPINIQPFSLVFFN